MGEQKISEFLKTGFGEQTISIKSLRVICPDSYDELLKKVQWNLDTDLLLTLLKHMSKFDV